MRKLETIPLELLFGNPTKFAPKLSPDGQYLSYLAPLNGVRNVWIKTIGLEDDRPITKDTGRAISSYYWAPGGDGILYLQDSDGNENWRLYFIPIIDGKPKLLTPSENVQVEIIAIDTAFPNEILIGLNERDPGLHDVYRLNLITGDLILEVMNEIGAAAWYADNDLKIRAAIVPTEGGEMSVAVRSSTNDWNELLRWQLEDSANSSIIGFDASNMWLRFVSSSSAETSELRSINILTGEIRTIFADGSNDVSRLFLHPSTYEVRAVAVQRDRLQWEVLDPSIIQHFEAIQGLHKGDYAIADCDNADMNWLVRFVMDDAPICYFLYTLETHSGQYLFSQRPELEAFVLAEMKPVTILARDGLTLHAYLTCPSAQSERNLPTVVMVHGGPWDRDEWRFDPEVQWLANQGYAVVQVNFRGSTGYGKAFLNAADKEWGGKMQDDITDTVNWLISAGTADPKRIAIYGGSYGGFAVLSGVSKTPDLFACGIDMVGPSNLLTFMATIPPYWEVYRPSMERRIGHPVQDHDMLVARSPFFHIDKIKAPLLIGQGAQDPRVPKEESRQIRDKLIEAGYEVEYIEFEDEGHGFVMPENQLRFYRAAEDFLKRHLG